MRAAARPRVAGLRRMIGSAYPRARTPVRGFSTGKRLSCENQHELCVCAHKYDRLLVTPQQPFDGGGGHTGGFKARYKLHSPVFGRACAARAVDLQVAKLTAHTGSDSEGWRQAASAGRLLAGGNVTRARIRREINRLLGGIFKTFSRQKPMNTGSSAFGLC